MQAEQAKGDKRRFPRWRIEGRRLTGRIAHGPQMSVVDLSLGGVLVEHPSYVEPGSILFLNVLFPGQEVSVKCRAVRSNLQRSEGSPTGAQELIYRTGLEFLEISEASRRPINGYIEFLKAMR